MRSPPISRKLVDEPMTIHCIDTMRFILCWINSCLNQRKQQAGLSLPETTGHNYCLGHRWQKNSRFTTDAQSHLFTQSSNHGPTYMYIPCLQSLAVFLYTQLALNAHSSYSSFHKHIFRWTRSATGTNSGGRVATDEHGPNPTVSVSGQNWFQRFSAL